MSRYSPTDCATVLAATVDPCGTISADLQTSACALRLRCEQIQTAANMPEYEDYITNKSAYATYKADKDATSYATYKAEKARVETAQVNAGREETRYADIVNQYSIATWVVVNLVLGLLFLAVFIWRARR